MCKVWRHSRLFWVCRRCPGNGLHINLTPISIMPVTQLKPRSTTLSQLELRTISQTISRDFAPRFFRPRSQEQRQTQFSAQELREIGRQISRDFSHTLEVVSQQLVLLPISPGHLHAYWQMDKQAVTVTPRVAVEPADHPTPPLTLRIYAEAPAPQQMVVANPEAPASLDIAVAAEQNHIEIFLPPEIGNMPQSGVYRAALGLKHEAQAFQALLLSNSAEPASLPRQQDQSTVSPALLQSIMSSSRHDSSVGKTSSGQGK